MSLISSNSGQPANLNTIDRIFKGDSETIKQGFLMAYGHDNDVTYLVSHIKLPKDGQLGSNISVVRNGDHLSWKIGDRDVTIGSSWFTRRMHVVKSFFSKKYRVQQENKVSQKVDMLLAALGPESTKEGTTKQEDPLSQQKSDSKSSSKSVTKSHSEKEARSKEESSSESIKSLKSVEKEKQVEEVSSSESIKSLKSVEKEKQVEEVSSSESMKSVEEEKQVEEESSDDSIKSSQSGEAGSLSELIEQLKSGEDDKTIDPQQVKDELHTETEAKEAELTTLQEDLDALNQMIADFQAKITENATAKQALAIQKNKTQSIINALNTFGVSNTDSWLFSTPDMNALVQYYPDLVDVNMTKEDKLVQLAASIQEIDDQIGVLEQDTNTHNSTINDIKDKQIPAKNIEITNKEAEINKNRDIDVLLGEIDKLNQT